MGEKESTITDETITERNDIRMTELLPFLQYSHLEFIKRANHSPPSHY